ncbi:hypothetical protein LSAT2_019005 [Lamellibrachia satsuma]|nr:hypothetical protein LSAT2_019005 [Lamellibrachia satsuma]
MISMTRSVILVVILCACLLATQAAKKGEQIRYGYPKGFNRRKKYWMEGGRITMPDSQVCRVHCTKEYFNCFKVKRCHMKRNEYLIKDCKEEYKACIPRCLRMLERIKNNDFPDA